MVYVNYDNLSWKYECGVIHRLPVANGIMKSAEQTWNCEVNGQVEVIERVLVVVYSWVYPHGPGQEMFRWQGSISSLRFLKKEWGEKESKNKSTLITSGCSPLVENSHKHCCVHVNNYIHLKGFFSLFFLGGGVGECDWWNWSHTIFVEIKKKMHLLNDGWLFTLLFF